MSSPDKPEGGDEPPAGQPPADDAGQSRHPVSTSSDAPGQSRHPVSSSSGEQVASVDAFYGVEQPASRARSTMQAVHPATLGEGAPGGGTMSGELGGSAMSGELAGGPTSILSDSDEPPLPALAPDAALQDAVGAPKRAKRRTPARDDDDRDDRGGDDDEGDTATTKWSRRTIMIAALAIIVGLGVAALVFLGRANAQRYAIACTTDHVSAEQGRAFPPWGTRPLVGAEWKSIPLPPNAECRPRETEDVAELEGWYLDLLVERASTTLTSPNLLDGVTAPGAPVVATNAKGQPVTLQNPLDAVAEQLNQALLLSRAPEHRDQRKEVERLLGDVQYWRASLRLRDASAALADASRQFDAAAAQRPRHVTDAGAWGAFLRKLSEELQAGPNGVPAVPNGPVPTADHSTAPVGVALPIEPTPTEPSGSDTAPSTPDAGVPSGGVLL